MQVNLPNAHNRQQAIGSLEAVPQSIRALLNANGFDPINVPGPQDWLANHPEPGQTFQQFLDSHPNRPEQIRRTIYLQPLERFSAPGPSLRDLKKWTEAFFAMPVHVREEIDYRTAGITSRINSSSGKRQLLTADILHLLSTQLPGDAYCLLGITMQDLYPDPSWNFVFGEASLRDRVGVYSFARYDPLFYGEDSSDRGQLILRRSCKVLAHETGHMFGIAHCIYFRCIMNGSNHLAESDARPPHLCPVDLRKLYWSISFDPISRYAHLREFCREVGFNDEAQWIDTQLTRVPQS
ncbi:MAG: hypothetical protein DMG64_12310 [Acidobacteria bacterium]|nr:MAG: hypothetical protein DMG64_12310 [Acidobacteriota bacterium]PYY20883.1 MAG: hypothetical protein DMG62_21405 [Acidobacteriota bacterium]